MASLRNTFLIEWLRQQGPDEWHRTATTWNWDSGNEVLLWIVTQPECDRGTALDVFWKGSPECHVLPAGPDNSWSNVGGFAEDHKLLSTILRNWKAGFYKTERFASEFVDGPLHWYFGTHDDPQLRRVQAAIPADMARSIAGEELDNRHYAEDMSPDAIKHLQSLGIQP